MKKRSALLPPGLVFLLAVGCGGWFLQKDVGAGANIYIHARAIDEVMRHIKDDFVEEVDVDDLYQAAITSMVGGLDDPNSRFLTAGDWENERIRTQGDYSGIGVEVNNLDGFLTVLAPIPGSPAAAAGLLAGDRIVEVDGETVVGPASGRAVDLLRGEPGRPVRIGIRRPGT
ncbi:MAG: PDZ domain-containing protein, partial [Gemmatimonadetes bacterium]|nr:PDZ domain-containing protein [Gemmatimonadota bacterium]